MNLLCKWYLTMRKEALIQHKLQVVPNHESIMSMRDGDQKGRITRNKRWSQGDQKERIHISLEPRSIVTLVLVRLQHKPCSGARAFTPSKPHHRSRLRRVDDAWDGDGGGDTYLIKDGGGDT